mgnify:CR=1 FL=1
MQVVWNLKFSVIFTSIRQKEEGKGEEDKDEDKKEEGERGRGGKEEERKIHGPLRTGLRPLSSVTASRPSLVLQDLGILLTAKAAQPGVSVPPG